jgi:hypothetical protein
MAAGRGVPGAAAILVSMATGPIFTLASGRSGTHFLYQLFRRNAANCVCRHEPYGWNPSMFGRPIYDLAVGDWGAIRRLAERKARIIRGYASATYVETSHAFLKSWSDAAMELFPDMKLVHVVRDPLKVAKSEAWRHGLLDWMHMPLRNYRGGDGRAYPRWALTGLEPIYKQFSGGSLTLFQRYVVQWIEIEHRAIQFLVKHGKHADCLTLDSPRELNDPSRVQEMFEFLGIQTRGGTIQIEGRRNRNPLATEVSDHDRAEFADVVGRLPAERLAIFGREPYVRFSWAKGLCSAGIS